MVTKKDHAAHTMSVEDHTYSFGYWLRRKRKALDLTQAVLADHVGCACSTIKRIEADARRPSRQLAARLADVLLLPHDERPVFIAAARAIHPADRLPIDDTPLAPVAVATHDLPVPMKSDAIPASKPRPQRKQVTVLHAALLGLEALIECEEPEVIVPSLETIWHTLRAIVVAHAGTILSHTESQFVVLWGATTARERDAEHAVHAALAIHAAVQANNHARHPLNVRIGVSTGVALLKGAAAFGEPVQQSLHLVVTSQDPAILLTHATYILVQSRFACSIHAPLHLPNTATTAIYAVMHARRPRANGLLDGAHAFMAPVIGREPELQRLHAALGAAAAHDEGAFITVVGDAGIGKSRVLAEFTAWTHTKLPGTRILCGRATPEGGVQPFALWRDIFSRTWNIQESDDATFVRATVAREVGAVLAVSDEALPPTALLYRFLGFARGTDPALDALGDARQVHTHGLRVLGDYLRALATRTPVVLLIEDLHWADDASLAALAYLGNVLEQTKLCIIGTTRPALFEQHPYWCSAPYHIRLDLSPLTRSDSRQLVAAMMQSVVPLPEQLQELVVQRADGNPFYIEELVTMLGDSHGMHAHPVPSVVDGVSLAQVSIPSTLRGVLEARLDALPANELAILQHAAVIGRTFWDAAVVQLGGDAPTAIPATAPRVLPELSMLQARGIVFERAYSTFDAAREYVFKHALLRDVAYDHLVQRTRQDLHQRTARWLEHVAEVNGRGDEYAGEIAAHYDAANAGGPAVAWYTRAARVAASQYAHVEALSALSRAIALLPRDALHERAAVLLAREHLHDVRADRRAQAQDLHLLELLAAELDDAARAEVAVRQTRHAMMCYDYDAAIGTVQWALHWAHAAGDNARAARGYLAWARSLYNLGCLAETQPPLQQAAMRAEASGQWEILAQCHWIRARLLLDSDQAVAAEQQFTHMLTLCRSHGLPMAEVDALDALGHMAYLQEQFPQARMYYEQAYALTRKIGDRRHECLALFALGHYWIATGDYRCAQTYIEQSLTLARSLESPGLICCDLAYLGLIHVHQHTYDRAHSYAREALTVPGIPDDKRALASMVAGHACVGLDQFDEALQQYTQATLLWHKQGRTRSALEAQAGMARVALRQGQDAQAMVYVNPILDHLARGGSLDETDEPFWIQLTCHQALQVTGDSRAARVLEVAYQSLQARATRFQDAELRGSCLGNVPHHRQLIQAWQEVHQGMINVPAPHVLS